ncbi:glycoside hydrolase domain-containing protein [Labilibaculum euxinus]
MRFQLLLLTYIFLLINTSCSKDNNIENVTPLQVDTTTSCRSVVESGAYSTFYKPQNGYVGDPMPYYNMDDNVCYLFYLQDWRNGAGTDHPIYCTTTKDYSSFSGLTQSIGTGESNSQEAYLGTGSFIKNSEGKLYGFYTGHNGNLYPAEKIMLATSTDMRTFTKVPSFTFEAPDGYDKNTFRDPCVYYDPTKSAYVMLVTAVKDGKGILARYTSVDLENWNLIAPLTDFDSDAGILECPDIFKMGNKWYLLFSRINRDEHRKTFYRMADSPDGPWKRCEDEKGHHETFDGLYLYAGKTASNGTERYLSGWCSTGQEVNGNNELDWAGSLITHKLVQQPSGKLYTTISEGVDNKFNTPADYLMVKSKGDVSGEDGTYLMRYQDGRSYGLFNRNTVPVKIELSIDASQSSKFGFSFGACDDLSEVYSVTFDLTSSNKWSAPALFLYKESIYSTGSYTNELNFTPLIVPEDNVFDIKIVIEKSICVVYVNNNVAFTNRIYKMNKNPWTIFVDDGQIEVSDLSIYKTVN